MSVLEETGAYLGRVGQSAIRPTAYDTAWVAALRVPGQPRSGAVPRFPLSLDWITLHQDPDGSWGAPWPCYHDRLLSTLRAVLTLHGWNRRAADRVRIERGLRYLWRHAHDLNQDPWETVGFELIMPTLLAEAEQRGLRLPYAAFDKVAQVREEKLARVRPVMHNLQALPLVTSLEGLGTDFPDEVAATAADAAGGVGTSIAATAFLLDRQPGNAPALAYLDGVIRNSLDGGMPAFFPIETMERSWALYHLQQAKPDICNVLPAAAPLLEFLHTTGEPGGWTASVHSALKEADTTGVCFAVLSQAGYELDPQLLYQYEVGTHFRCYPFERNPSISANAHMLAALHYCDPQERAPRVEKVLGFLRSVQHPGGFWFDKWHVSPYYVTAHIIFAAHAVAPALIAPAVEWLIHTQMEDGSWGYYQATIEETAYAVLALLTWHDAGHALPADVLRRGAAYLRAHFSLELRDYIPLWIGKSLYAPIAVIQSAILAALLACEDRL